MGANLETSCYAYCECWTHQQNMQSYWLYWTEHILSRRKYIIKVTTRILKTKIKYFVYTRTYKSKAFLYTKRQSIHENWGNLFIKFVTLLKEPEEEEEEKFPKECFLKCIIHLKCINKTFVKIYKCSGVEFLYASKLPVTPFEINFRQCWCDVLCKQINFVEFF